MTVIVNAVSAKMGGGATYLRELVRELAGRALPHRLIFYVPPEQAGLAAGLPGHIECRVTPIGHAGALRRLWWDQVTLRRILRRERADVLYSTANFGMLFCPVPQLLFIQNSLYISPVYHSHILPRKSWHFRLVFALRSWLQRHSVRRATVVMTPSQAQLDELAAGGSPPRSPMRVNHFGTRLPVAGQRSAARGGSGRPFRLLYPAFYYEHKNLGTLLRALKQLRLRHGLEVELLTTADPSSPLARSAATAAADRELARDPVLASCVRFLESRPPEQMAELYAGCDLLVYPTVVESFGLPLIEALACGMPIVASDLPINRELAGDVPLYFQPFDPDDLADKILTLANDPALRAHLAAAGAERARLYTWPAHVDRLLAILEETQNS